jgi:hypothetical protein
MMMMVMVVVVMMYDEKTYLISERRFIMTVFDRT